MELRQLRYFLAVARELHFGRAAEQLHIAGPSLSQQIIGLERELGVALLIRDRRSVTLTDAGRSLLEDAGQLLALADSAVQRARSAAGQSITVRFGYVSWMPDGLEALAGASAAVRVDEWVLPSHAQADRVAEGSLDVALACVTAEGAAARGLVAHLVRAEPLYAVAPGRVAQGPIAAKELAVLVDSDESAWSSWNDFAREFAAAAGAQVIEINDGGITGQAFYAHVAALGRPVLESPKRHVAVPPASLGRSSVVAPTPLWTWSLLHRADDDRPEISQLTEALTTNGRVRGWLTPPAGAWWVPQDDPHRSLLSTGR